MSDLGLGIRGRVVASVLGEQVGDRVPVTGAPGSFVSGHPFHHLVAVHLFTLSGPARMRPPPAAAFRGRHVSGRRTSSTPPPPPSGSPLGDQRPGAGPASSMPLTISRARSAGRPRLRTVAA